MSIIPAIQIKELGCYWMTKPDGTRRLVVVRPIPGGFDYVDTIYGVAFSIPEDATFEPAYGVRITWQEYLASAHISQSVQTQIP